MEKFEPVIESEVDERRWLWLQSHASPQQIAAAFESLGKRRAYPSTLAKALKLSWPDDSDLPRTAAQIAAARAEFEAVHKPRILAIREKLKRERGV